MNESTRAAALASTRALIIKVGEQLETLKKLETALDCGCALTMVERATNRETLQRERARYLAGELTHEGYYQFLAEFIGAGPDLIPFTPEQVGASRDPNLNDLPLGRWDAADPEVRKLAYRKGLPWSLSDTVCILKFLARSTSTWERRNLEAKP